MLSTVFKHDLMRHARVSHTLCLFFVHTGMPSSNGRYVTHRDVNTAFIPAEIIWCLPQTVSDIEHFIPFHSWHASLCTGTEVSQVLFSNNKNNSLTQIFILSLFIQWFLKQLVASGLAREPQAKEKQRGLVLCRLPREFGILLRLLFLMLESLISALHSHPTPHTARVAAQFDPAWVNLQETTPQFLEMKHCQNNTNTCAAAFVLLPFLFLSARGRNGSGKGGEKEGEP